MVYASIRSWGMAHVILEKRSTMTNRCSFPAAARVRGPSRSMHKSFSGSVGANVLREFVLRHLPTRFRAHCVQLATKA